MIESSSDRCTGIARHAKSVMTHHNLRAQMFIANFTMVWTAGVIVDESSGASFTLSRAFSDAGDQEIPLIDLAASELSEGDRAALAGLLIESLESEWDPAPEVEAALRKAIERRVAEK